MFLLWEHFIQMVFWLFFREKCLRRCEWRPERRKIYWCFICFVVTLSLCNGYGITWKIDSHGAVANSRNSFDPFDISIHSETAQITTWIFAAHNLLARSLAHHIFASADNDGGGGDGGFRAIECFISRSVNFISNRDIIKLKWTCDWTRKMI